MTMSAPCPSPSTRRATLSSFKSTWNGVPSLSRCATNYGKTSRFLNPSICSTFLCERLGLLPTNNLRSLTPHPFIAMLSHAKGKRLIPRLFHYIDEQERITLVTMIIVHLDKLPVVLHGIATPDEPLSPAMRDEVELFATTVVPSLMTHI